jgi:hypothetical protein
VHPLCIRSDSSALVAAASKIGSVFRELADVQRVAFGLGPSAADVQEVGGAIRIAVGRVLREEDRIAKGIRVVWVRGHEKEICKAYRSSRVHG